MISLETYCLFWLLIGPMAFKIIYDYLNSVRYSNRKIGGIRFVKVNRLSMSFCVVKEA